jgi:peptidoglycan/xylan/chitin deacetylase (PgdA/CDA1 family)
MSWLMIASCAQVYGPQGSYRRISSIETIAQDQQPDTHAQEMLQKFKTIEHTTLLAYEQLSLFDEHLNSQGGELFQNPHYSGLLAARAQIDELQHQLLDWRDQLFEIVLDEDRSLERRQTSLLMLKATFPATKSDSDWLVFHKLHQETSQFTRLLLMKLTTVREESIRRSLETLYSELEAHYGPLKDRKDMSADWRTVSSKARLELKDDADWQMARRNFEHLSLEMRTQLKDLRAPKAQEEVFRPSAEKAGNITGLEFPPKVWSLTFDDGPSESFTKKILENLEMHQLKATFFQLTREVQEQEGSARAIRESPMEIASHSYTHRELTKVSIDQRLWEIQTAAQELSTLQARPIKYFRLPYGAGVGNSDIRTKIAEAGLIHVFWSVDTLDWMAQSQSDVVQRTLRQMRSSRKDAGVILFHDVHERTVGSSEEIMRYLKQDNRRVCTLDEIVTAMNARQTPCPN